MDFPPRSDLYTEYFSNILVMVVMGFRSLTPTFESEPHLPSYAFVSHFKFAVHLNFQDPGILRVNLCYAHLTALIKHETFLFSCTLS